MSSAAMQAAKADIKDAELSMLSAFKSAIDDGPFAGLYDREQAIGGAVKFVTMGSGERLEEIVGQINPSTVTTATQSVVVKEFGDALRIPWSFWEQGRRMAGTQFARRFTTLGSDWASLITERLTLLIEANGNAIWGSAYFNDAGVPVGARSGVTVDNIYTATLAGATPTTGEMRTAFHGAKALLATMQDSSGKRFHGANPEAGGLALMYSPSVAATVDVVEEVFSQKMRTGGGDNPFAGRVQLRANAELVSGLDMYVFRLTPKRSAPFVTNDFAPPVLHNNLPRNGVAEEAVMLQKAVTFASWFDFIEAPGNPMESIYIDFTAT